MLIERRFHIGEIRANESKMRLVGHAAVFNQLSEELFGFREMIRPGAFAETIKRADVRALWNHDPNFPLARTTNKTLRLEEDNVGLAMEADLVNASYARDLVKSIERGDVDQMSFGFIVLPDGEVWSMQDGGYVRELINVELFDVSPVTYAAYPQTDIEAERRELRSRFEAVVRQMTDNHPRIEDVVLEARQKTMQQRRAFIERYQIQLTPLEEAIKRARITK